MRRRDFLIQSTGCVAAFAAQPRIRFATSGFIWQNDIETGIKTTARFGFHGIEPFRQHIMKYLDRPRDLKRQLDAAGISLVTCSNGGGMATNFIDKAEAARSIDDHETFARDFIAHFGCKHFKINCGRRPADTATTDEQLTIMSGAFNELGRRIAKYGLKLAPHPHIWSPLERENEVRRVMELTDPRYVGMVTDAAHLTLGGMDPLQIIRDFYPRVAAVHFKDTEARYRGFRGPTPSQEEHRKVNLYKNLGAGGVDFPGIIRLLEQRSYEGWITLDLDPPRPGDGTIDENIEINRKYLVDRLGNKL